MSTTQHGTASSYRRRCKCDDCREAYAAYFRELRARKAAEPMPADVEHGSAVAYNYWGCRCDRCRRGARDRHYVRAKKQQARREEARLAGLEVAPHGVLDTYDRLQCRCDECAEAHRQRLLAGAKHGQQHVYAQLGCRCRLCTNAHTAQKRVQQSRRLERGVPDDAPHGSVSTYKNWGCRCDECAAENVRSSREYKRRRRAARSA